MAAIAGTMIASIMTCYHGVVAGGLTEAISERFYDSFLFLNTAFIFVLPAYGLLPIIFQKGGKNSPISWKHVFWRHAF